MWPVVRRSIAVRPDYRGLSAAAGPAHRATVNRPASASNFPSRPTPGWRATPSRPASSSISTRPIQFRAFALADPYRVVVDIPQVNFQLAAGTGVGRARAGQGVPLWPRDAGRLADRVRPDGAGEDRQFLCAGGGQRPAAAAGAGVRRGRPRPPSSSCWRPRIVPSCGPRSPDANAAVAAGRTPAAKPGRRTADTRPVVVIDPGHGGIDNGTQAAAAKCEKNLVLAFGLALRDRIEKIGKYRVVMTRTDDTFIPLDDRVQDRAQPVGGAVRLDPCRRAAAQRGRRPGRHDLYAVRQGIRRRSRAAGRNRKQGRRDRRREPDGRADRGRRYPDRSGAARNPNLFKPFRAPA